MEIRQESPDDLPKQAAEGYTKLSIYLNPEAAETLAKYTAKRGISYTEAIRRAVAVLKFVDDEISAGREVQVRDGESVQKISLVS